MFTGIIAGTGTLEAIRRGSGDFSMDVQTAGVVDNPVIGESVALNGVCLTVFAITGGMLTFDVSQETISRTTFKSARPGERVNIERALALGDRMGGHMVQGHVDCVGTLARAARAGEGYEIEIELVPEGMKYVIEKGSIAIAGISLTVASKRDSSITVAVIPHTWEVTTLKELSTGSTVNIEYDMIAKYVESIVKPFNAMGGGSIDRDFLSRHGF